MEWNFVKDNENIVDERLKVGREYLVKTYTGEYDVSTYTIKHQFWCLPLLVKAWAEFDRCEE